MRFLFLLFSLNTFADDTSYLTRSIEQDSSLNAFILSASNFTNDSHYCRSWNFSGYFENTGGRPAMLYSVQTEDFLIAPYEQIKIQVSRTDNRNDLSLDAWTFNYYSADALCFRMPIFNREIQIKNVSKDQCMQRAHGASNFSAFYGAVKPCDGNKGQFFYFYKLSNGYFQIRSELYDKPRCLSLNQGKLETRKILAMGSCIDNMGTQLWSLKTFNSDAAINASTNYQIRNKASGKCLITMNTDGVDYLTTGDCNYVSDEKWVIR